MKIFKRILMFIGFLVVSFVAFVAFIIVTDFDPKLVEASEILRDNGTSITGTTFSVTTFNIGYCGLDDGQEIAIDGAYHLNTERKRQLSGG